MNNLCRMSCVSVVLALAACGASTATTTPPAAGDDAGAPDSPDASTPQDAGQQDAGQQDAGQQDAGQQDAGQQDAGQDAGTTPSRDGGVGPRGLYALGRTDSKVPALAYDFISGATLRLTWKHTEPTSGQYDFSLVDESVAALMPLNQKLTIEVMAVQYPPYVLSGAAETWNIAMDGQPEERQPVPWDESAQQAWARYQRALADHLVRTADGTLVRLADHPTLETVDAAIVGLQGLRDLSGHLAVHPSYTRTKFLDAFVRSVHASRDVFPAKSGFVGLFGMSDADRNAPLSDAVVDRLLVEFGNPGQPSLGLFQELLADATPTASGGLGRLLLRGKPKFYVVFQALTSWTAPFTGADKVTSGNPNTGIAHAYNTFGARYVELYLPDLSTQAFWPEFRTWSATLTR